MYDWYNLFSLTEFEAADLVSRSITVVLEGVGEKEILITKGNTTGITYEGVFLPVNFLGKNPFEFEEYAVYLDADNNVWLGLEVEG